MTGGVSIHVHIPKFKTFYLLGLPFLVPGAFGLVAAFVKNGVAHHINDNELTRSLNRTLRYGLYMAACIIGGVIDSIFCILALDFLLGTKCHSELGKCICRGTCRRLFFGTGDTHYLNSDQIPMYGGDPCSDLNNIVGICYGLFAMMIMGWIFCLAGSIISRSARCCKQRDTQMVMMHSYPGQVVTVDSYDQPPLYPSAQYAAQGNQAPLYPGAQYAVQGNQAPLYPGAQYAVQGNQAPLYPGAQYAVRGEQAPPYPGAQYAVRGEQAPLYPSAQYAVRGEQAPLYPGAQYAVQGNQAPPYPVPQYAVRGEQAPLYPSAQYAVQGNQAPPYPGAQYAAQGDQPPLYPGSQYAVQGEQAPPYPGAQYAAPSAPMLEPEKDDKNEYNYNKMA